ncbi:MAG: hypothetical protein BYD32DRAFT_421299 [Podila humilis]|nr:MAG: hypothetical protein BYD32DRAFT_421299 [Podila humilis]
MVVWLLLVLLLKERVYKSNAAEPRSRKQLDKGCDFLFYSRCEMCICTCRVYKEFVCVSVSFKNQKKKVSFCPKEGGNPLHINK